MAFATANFLVLPFQPEAGFIMVEVPVFPIARVMASLASRAQRAFMHILFFVTRPAVRLGILELGGQMAFFAFGQNVLSGKREAGLRMVELGFFP